MTASLTDLRPPPTVPPIASLHARQRPSTAGYWVAAVVAVLGLVAAFVWGAAGIHTTGDRVDGLARLAVPGATTVSVADPGTMVIYHESAAEVAGYTEPTATGRIAATRWDPGTRTTVTVRYPADAPTWQQLGLQVTGPSGAVVPVATYRSSVRYDLEPGRAGRALATFQASIAGPYRVSAARATEAGARLAVGQDVARSLVLTRLGAVVLGLVTVVTAVPLAVATYRARSRTIR